MKNKISDFLFLFGWAGGPPLILFGQSLVESLVSPERLPAFHSEQGPHESFQALFMLMAVFVGCRLLYTLTLSRKKEKGGALVWWWILIAVLGSVYVAGEEISWGQHFLNWETPEYWAAVNDQNETNLHNTSSWFDQKPRALLFVGIVVGGILIPGFRRWKPSLLPTRFSLLYPSSKLLPVALGGFLIYVAEYAYHKTTGHRLFTRASEVQELYMYLFVLLYFVDFGRRLTFSERDADSFVSKER